MSLDQNTTSHKPSVHPWLIALPYIAPFVLYLTLTQIPPAYPDDYAWMYPTVVLLVGTTSILLLRGRRMLIVHRHVLPGVAVGLAGIALWIGLCHLRLEKQLAAYLPEMLRPKERAAFDPFTAISHPALRWAFLGFRLVGLVLVVPVAEELFWRGFLLRWLIDSDWQRQKVGQFTLFSCTGVVLLFTLAHPEWFAAAVYCALLNGLIYWTRDLWNCVIAHAVSNLVLAIYILGTGHWELW
jgi:CAAX prenyl protease-like protein